MVGNQFKFLSVYLRPVNEWMRALLDSVQWGMLTGSRVDESSMGDVYCERSGGRLVVGRSADLWIACFFRNSFPARKVRRSPAVFHPT